MIKWFLLFILGVGTGLGIYLFIHLGAFKKVYVEVQQFPSYYTAYKIHRGPYHEINSMLTSIETQINKMGMRCKSTFGHFLDDPATMDADRLKSHVGCVVSEEVFKALSANHPEDFKLVLQPTMKVVYARFQGSPAIGPMKVYPEVNKFADRQRVQLRPDVIEIYNIQRNGDVTTEYLFSIETQ